MVPNPVAPGDASGIPKGTSHQTESDILDKLKSFGRGFKTLGDVALHGIEGEPLDDKTYLMERIIQLTADLPLHDKLSDTLTHKLLGELWNDLDHPPQSYLGHDYVFRKADGSNNNILWPHIGKAGQPYARSVRPKKMQPPRPDPGAIFDSVLKRKEFRPHPNKISSVLFYLASIIIHDCFHTSHKDYAISETSSYLDLSPLYGSNYEQQKDVRTFQNGKLKPDCFSDSRIMGFPPGVGVLLIMFNRFHNNVAENLAKIDEGGRFGGILDTKKKRRTGLTPPEKTDENGKPLGADKQPSPQELYDEALFQTARLVTTGLYINIILNDYVRTILGLNRVDTLWNLDPRGAFNKGLSKAKIPEAGGNQVSAEFSLVYRWHCTVSQRDEKWTDALLKKIIAASQDPNKLTNPMDAIGAWASEILGQLPEKRDFEGLKRQANGAFSDDDLSKIWMDSVDDVAGAFGAAHVPANLKFVEVLSMIQSRSWNLASLNEFREYFKLQPHKTFEDINPDPHIAAQLKKLYGHPDNVEIYPGIVVESAKVSMSPGSGLCASWTTSRAILSDAVALVRGDRFYTIDYTPNNLTNWGFKTADFDQDINWGGVFYKLVLNAFPDHIAKNSVYAHFPLVNPPENKMLLTKLKRNHLFSFDKPVARSTVTVEASASLAAKALTDTSKFTSLWTARSAAFGATEEAKVKPTSKALFAEAILADEKWKAVTTKFYTTTLEKFWNEQQYELGGYQQVDIVADVLNRAHTTFISSVLGVPVASDDDHDRQHQHHHGGFLESLGCVFESAFEPQAKPKGLATTIRDSTQHIVSAIGSFLRGGGSKSDSVSKEEELGKRALARLGTSASKETIWQDILPTAALLLTSLSRSSASAVESAITDKEPSTPSVPNINLCIGVRDTTKNEIVVVDLASAQSKAEIAKLGPEVELAHQVAEIANRAILDLISKVKDIDRVQGPQGRIKKVTFDTGEIKYLNEVQSDYVAYPVSLKVRWIKQ